MTEREDAHFSGKISQKAIIERNGKVLVCRGVGDTIWELPGGRLHQGEAPVAGVAREIKEELGLDIVNIRPLSVDASFHQKTQKHQVLITYTCTLAGGEPVVDATEVEEYRWVTREELKVLPMFPDYETVVTLWCEAE